MIIIRDFDMPISCSRCPFLDDSGDYPYCQVNATTHGYNFNTLKYRMPECPLRDIKDLTLREICDKILS